MNQILGLSRVGRLPSSRTDWGTPQGLFDELNAEFHFTLDPCATPENAKCDRYFSLLNGKNGLWKSWAGERVFMNPPFGREVGAWVRKAYQESQRGALIVCLLPARTDTAWWHDYCMKGEIRFLRGRVKFDGARWNAPFPCAVVIFRATPDLTDPIEDQAFAFYAPERGSS